MPSCSSSAARPGLTCTHLRVLRYGANLHIDCHMQLPYYFSLEETHNELNAIEGVIKAVSTWTWRCSCTPDPCTFAACSLCAMPDCPVRQHAFSHEIGWTVANAVKNERHRLPG